MSVRIVLAIGCLALASCDQFARVGAIEPSPDAAQAPEDAGPDRDAQALDADVDAGDGNVDGGSCRGAMPAVCDPVKNFGCSGALSMQCAIDYARQLTGYCIFASPPAPGMVGECFNSGVTESCPATFTCFADHCEKICLCDGDCPEGRCCSQPVDATGFSVCGDC